MFHKHSTYNPTGATWPLTVSNQSFLVGRHQQTIVDRSVQYATRRFNGVNFLVHFANLLFGLFRIRPISHSHIIVHFHCSFILLFHCSSFPPPTARTDFSRTVYAVSRISYAQPVSVTVLSVPLISAR